MLISIKEKQQNSDLKFHIKKLENFSWLFLPLLGALGSGYLVHHIPKLTRLQSEHHGDGVAVHSCLLIFCRVKQLQQQQQKTKTIQQIALARQLSWLEYCPIHQKVEGLIPSQGAHVGCRFNPQLGCLGEAINQCFSHMSFSVSSIILPSSEDQIRNKK